MGTKFVSITGLTVARSTAIIILNYVVAIGYYKLPLDYLNTFNNNIEEVTVDKIKDVFKRRLSPEKFVIVTVGKSPEKINKDKF